MDTIRETLKDANEICRSAYQIAVRDGRETNWEAFIGRLEKSLRLQADALAPAPEQTDLRERLANAIEDLELPPMSSWQVKAIVDAVMPLLPQPAATHVALGNLLTILDGYVENYQLKLLDGDAEVVRLARGVWERWRTWDQEDDL